MDDRRHRSGVVFQERLDRGIDRRSPRSAARRPGHSRSHRGRCRSATSARRSVPGRVVLAGHLDVRLRTPRTSALIRSSSVATTTASTRLRITGSLPDVLNHGPARNRSEWFTRKTGRAISRGEDRHDGHDPILTESIAIHEGIRRIRTFEPQVSCDAIAEPDC